MSAAVFALVLPLLAVEVPADQAAPADIFDAFPVAVDGAVVPENGRLLVTGSTRFLATHANGDVEDLTATGPVVTMHTREWRTVTPTLIEGDTISLERVCDDCAGELPLVWTVGPADNDAPVFTDAEANANGGIVGLYDNDPERFNNNRYGFNVSAFLAPLQTPEFTVVRVTGGGVDVSAVTFDDMFVSFAVPGPEEREACFQAVASDAAGNASAPYDFCVDLVDDRSFFGCAQAGAPTSMLFALTAVLLRRRRR